jgi:hypothetical protein
MPLERPDCLLHGAVARAELSLSAVLGYPTDPIGHKGEHMAVL